jgi:hypothetical protein
VKLVDHVAEDAPALVGLTARVDDRLVALRNDALSELGVVDGVVATAVPPFVESDIDTYVVDGVLDVLTAPSMVTATVAPVGTAEARVRAIVSPDVAFAVGPATPLTESLVVDPLLVTWTA